MGTKKKEAQKALKRAIKVAKGVVTAKKHADHHDKRMNKVRPGKANKKVDRNTKTARLYLKVAKKKNKEAVYLLSVGKNKEAERKGDEAARKAADVLKKVASGMSK